MPRSRLLAQGVLRLIPAGRRHSVLAYGSRQLARASTSQPWPHVRQAGRPRAFRPQFRPFSSTAVRKHGHAQPPKPGEEIWVTFVTPEGEEHKVAASEGDNLLDVAQANDLDVEGACGGVCACSTCHVIVMDDDYYDKMNECQDDEADMLDMAFGLTETSRLGCQVILTKDLDGLRVKLPAMTRNIQAKDLGSSSTKKDES